MKIVQINTVCGSGSTGKICVAVSQLLTQKNIENYVLYASGKSEYPLGIRYMTNKEGLEKAVKFLSGIIIRDPKPSTMHWA